MQQNKVKVNCSWCGKEIECPEDMLNVEKHGCFECFKKIEEGKITLENSGKAHFDIPTEEAIERTASFYTEEVFPEVWKEHKEKLKELSKKEIAQNMFYLGMRFFMENANEAQKEKSEENYKVETEKD